MSSKQEKIFIFWSKSTGKYSLLSSLLAKDGWQLMVTSSGPSLAQFEDGETEARDKLICLAILNPKGKLSPEDICSIKRFVSNGHRALLASSASDQEGPARSNLNELSSLFGVTFNEDRVIRPNPFKLYHPTEAVLDDCIANRGLGDSMGKFIDSSRRNDELLAEIVQAGASPGEGSAAAAVVAPGPRIVYPRGCSLKTLSKSATVMLSSSKWALPSCQPICVFHRDDGSKARLVALGSANLLSDKFIDCEDNKAFVCSILEFLTKDDYHINISDARTIEIGENNVTADMDKLVNTPISCLQQLEPLPRDKLTLIDRRLFSMDNSKLPEVLRAYDELNVPNRRLTLMRPNFNWREPGQRETSASRLKLLLWRSDGRLEMI